jgi:DNA topoisomerase-1
MIVGKKLGIVDEEDEASKTLPIYKDGEAVQLNEIAASQHFTQPPARYTDASLVKKLEELEVGRPSTYAPTISTIQNRGYVIREGRAFIPTDVAYVVIDLLVQNFPNIVDYGFTADIEKRLDDVAEGTVEWVPIIRDFYVPFEKDLIEKEKILSKSEITNLGESDEDCPKCGKKLIIKLGKYGKFLSCSDYPTCDYAKPMDEAGIEGGEGAQEDYGTCDKCNEGKMILKRGRFGKFLACNNYPKCKNTKPFLVKIGFACPKCVTGDVVVKKAKRKVFYGCSRYPDCDWSSWTNPKPQELVENIAGES